MTVSLPVTASSGGVATQQRGALLSGSQLHRLHEALSQLQVELDERMRSASATLQELREASSLTDPDIQAPLMTALHTIDVAERQAADVAAALDRMREGSYGVCGRCALPIPVERLELRPAGRFCVECSR